MGCFAIWLQRRRDCGGNEPRRSKMDNGRDTATCIAQQNMKGKQEELNGSNLVSSVEAVRMLSSRSRPNWILAAAGPRLEPCATPAVIPVAPESWAT